MLRTDNGSFLNHSNNVNYAKRPADKCVARRDEVDKIRKASCDPNADAVRQLDDLHRQNACKVHTCVPLKSCMAKVGLHDANGNFLTKEMIGSNVDSNLRVGGNQIGYVYQQKSITDQDALINALRNNQALAPGVAQKIAQSNQELFGKPHAWDGSDMGYFCPALCAEKPKPCPKEYCKKADPLFNPTLGIGSDGLQAKMDLRETNEGKVYQKNMEGYFLGEAPRRRGAGVAVVATAETGVGETLRGKPFKHDPQRPAGRPTLEQQRERRAKGTVDLEDLD